MKFLRWLFRRPEPLVVTADCVARWLNARQPDFLMFVRLPKDQQQLMADQGAAFTAERVVELLKGFEVGREVFEAQAFPDDPDSQRVLMKLAAAEYMQEMGQAAQAPQMPSAAPAASEPLSMVGALDRREAAAEERRASSQRRLQFLGMRPTRIVPRESEEDPSVRATLDELKGTGREDDDEEVVAG